MLFELAVAPRDRTLWDGRGIQYLAQLLDRIQDVMSDLDLLLGAESDLVEETLHVLCLLAGE